MGEILWWKRFYRSGHRMGPLKRCEQVMLKFWNLSADFLAPTQFVFAAAAFTKSLMMATS